MSSAWMRGIKSKKSKWQKQIKNIHCDDVETAIQAIREGGQISYDKDGMHVEILVEKIDPLRIQPDW